MAFHWVVKDHICKWCGANLLHPTTTSECPSQPKPKPNPGMKHLVTMLLALVVWQGSIGASSINPYYGIYRLVYCDDDTLAVEKKMIETDSLGNTGTMWLTTDDTSWNGVNLAVYEAAIKALVGKPKTAPQFPQAGSK